MRTFSYFFEHRKRLFIVLTILFLASVFGMVILFHISRGNNNIGKAKKPNSPSTKENESKMLQISLDKSGLKEIATEFQNNFNPGDPDVLRDFIDSFDMAKSTTPIETQNVKISKFENKKVQNMVGKKIKSELLSFPSHVKYPVKQEQAIFYLFRNSKLQNHKVILWIPGKGVSNFAFRFIRRFFKIELEQGYNVLVYIPPFHMERKTKNNPDTFFTSDIRHNLLLYLECLRELRTGIAFLKEQKVKSISGWGGSMGGSMLLNLTNIEKFEHISVMIPVLNWKTLTFDNDIIKKVVAKYENAGFSKTLLEKAYSLISPSSYDIGLSPEQVQIQYAKYDQLTPEQTTLNFAKIHKITNITGYKKSHATILLSQKLYKDYTKFIASL